MLIDARSVPQDASLDTQICIIGAGAAGIAIALELAHRKFRVCLLESGGFEADAETQSLYRGSSLGHRYFPLDEARTRAFGGSTHCWMGLCRPLDRDDFTARDWIPHSGWPFDRASLVPYYERAQQTCLLEEFAYDGSRWAGPERPLLPFAGGRVVTRSFQVAPTRFGSVYREPLTSAENIDVHLHANVVEIEPYESLRAVRRLRVATLAGNRFWVRPKLVILATGGIENARLLLASNRIQRTGLGNQHGLVGRFFMEHPHVPAGSFLPSTRGRRLDLYRQHPRGRVVVIGILALSEEVRRRERLANLVCWLGGPAQLGEFERVLAGSIGDMDGGGEAAPRELAEPESTYLLMNECEQVPNQESRVELSHDRDALGMNRVKLKWRLTAQDRDSLRRSHEIIARELGRAGIGRLKLTLAEDDPSWPDGMIGGRHHMGTTRMHADPKRGVVDPDCRVHGMENLFVAGSSVFPTVGAANPTLTLVALALRLADHVRESFA